MNYKALLDKYWAGETSIAEEKALKVYFSGNEVAEELLPYAGIFQYYEVAQKERLPSTVENLLVSKKKPSTKRLFALPNHWFGKIAAAILVLILATVGWQNLQTPSKAEKIAAYWASKEIKDPKVALLKTKAALLLVSKKLNSGTEAALQQVSKVQQVGQFIKSPE